MNKFIIWSFLFLSTTNLFGQKMNSIKGQVECMSPRFLEAKDFSITNLNKGEYYNLIFPFNHEGLVIENLLKNEPVSNISFNNNVLNFKSLSNSINLHHPGLQYQFPIINCGEFDVREVSPINKMMGITTETGSTAEYLINNVLLGDFCLDVQNILFSNSSTTYGEFSGGMDAIGIESGVVLATGNINLAEGPNTSGGSSNNGGSNSPDPDIAQIVGSTVQRDIVKFEFDFVPDEGNISFDFVFASEEYCDFVNSNFNDAFGFFLSGPGITGPYSNGAENIAALPDGTPVTINNVNWCNNDAFYVTNAVSDGIGAGCAGQGCTQDEINAPKPNSNFIGFDGYTTKLTASSEVIPCETYHIKIVIADIGDGAWDSGVFLGGNSFVSGDADVKVNIASGSNDDNNIADEGCENGYIAFVKDPIDQEITFSLEILPSSTATQGVDYENIPLTYTIPAGVQFDTLWIDIFADLFIEGIETIDLKIIGICDCDDPVITIEIEDPLIYERDISICEGEFYDSSQGPISTEGEFYEIVQSFNGCDSLFLTTLEIRDKTYYDTTIYRCWNEPLEFMGETFNFPPAIEVFILENQNFVACDSVIQMFFEWQDPNYLAEVMDTLNCDNESVQLNIINSTIPDNVSFYWLDPNQDTIFQDEPEVTLPGIYELISLLELEDRVCQNFFPTLVDVEIDSLFPNIQPIDDITVYCGLDGPIISADISNANDFDDLIISWTGPNNFASNDTTIIIVDTGSYKLIVESPSSGCITEQEIIVSSEEIIPEIDIINVGIGCNAPSVELTTTVDVDGGIFSWTGPNGFNSAEQSPTITETGTYNVQYSLSPSCINSASIEVTEDNILPEINAIGDTIICNQGIGILNFSATDYQNFTWTGPNGFISTEPSPEVTEQGNYTISVQGLNGCIDSVTVNLEYIDIIPQLSTADDIIDCSSPTINLFSNVGNSTVTYNWEGPNGFNSIEAQPEIDEGGYYSLTVTNVEGCNIIGSSTITVDTLSPNITVNQPLITCSNPTIDIISTSIDNISMYTWEGPNSQSGNEAILNVSEPGIYTLIATGENNCSTIISTLIGIDTISPQVEAFGDTLDCNTGLATIFAESAIANILFTWYDPNENPITTDLSSIINTSGIYTYSVTNTINGCTNEGFVEVADNESTPDLALQADTITCENKDFTIQSISSFTDLNYAWTGPSGFNSIDENVSITESGDYQLQIISNEGCITNKVITVDADLLPPVLSPVNGFIDCNHAEVNLGFNTDGGNYSFEWEGPNNFTSTEQNPLISENGLYTVLATAENFCTSSVSVIIDSDFATPSLSVNVPELITCYEPSSNIDITTDAPTGSSFYWTGPNNYESDQQNISVSIAGTYNITITGTNGCTEEESVIISDNLDLISLQSEDDVLNCYESEKNASISYENSSAIDLIQWSGPNGFESSESNPLLSETGMYNVIVTADNGCTSVAQINITSDFNIPTSEIEGGEISCETPIISISTTNELPNYQYNWESNNPVDILETTASITVSEAGNYSVTIFDVNNGCSTVQNITIDALPDITNFDFSVQNPNCFSPYGNISIESIEGGTGPYMYSIDGGQNFQSTNIFNELTGGEYTIVVVDDKACTNNAQTEVISFEEYEINSEGLHTIFLGDSKQIIVSSGIDETDIASIVWAPDTDLSCNDCLEPITTTKTDIIYSITITDKDGCILTEDIEIRVLENPYFLPNVFTPNGDGINDFFTIFGKIKNLEVIETFNIYDRWGENVFTVENADPFSEEVKWFGNFKSQPVQSGVYAYYIRYTLIDGKSYFKQGDVTIVR